MTVIILAVQVALPLAMLLWLALLPAASLGGFVLQVAGTGAMLFALAQVAQWAVPVWWLPMLYGGLWLVIVLCLGGWYGEQALAGRALPPISGAPLALRIDGRFLVRGDRLTGRGGQGHLTLGPPADAAPWARFFRVGCVVRTGRPGRITPHGTLGGDAPAQAPARQGPREAGPRAAAIRARKAKRRYKDT